MRWNHQAIPRDQFLYTLTRRDVVSSFRRLNQCMLCLREGVNEAGVCGVCYALLDGKELDAVLQWTQGAKP